MAISAGIVCCVLAMAVVQVSTFAKLVGQSFEVQFTIAAINTLLTTAGAIRPPHDSDTLFMCPGAWSSYRYWCDANSRHAC